MFRTQIDRICRGRQETFPTLTNINTQIFTDKTDGHKYNSL